MNQAEVSGRNGGAGPGRLCLPEGVLAGSGVSLSGATGRIAGSVIVIDILFVLGSNAPEKIAQAIKGQAGI